MVDVSDSLLIGQPVSAVVRTLRQQGLEVQVRWKASDAQAPGTVLSVRPIGRRPVGSLITVIGARHGKGRAGAGDDNGNNGHGNDHGGGGGN
jgi:hypothetical protein